MGTSSAAAAEDIVRRACSCKANYVPNVKIMLSLCREKEARPALAITDNAVICLDTPLKRVQESLDGSNKCDMIYLTHMLFGDQHVCRPDQQAQVVTPARHLKSAPPRRSPRPFSSGRLFRSSRPHSGQVRDATSGTRRGQTHSTSGQELRLVATIVLSGASGLSGIRVGGLASSTAWAAGRSQTNRRCNEVRSRTEGGRCFLVTQAAGASRPSRVWLEGASAQHRPPVAPSKKTAVSSSAVDLVSAKECLIRAYEDLRHQVLDIAKDNKPGPGLALFLSRGMLDWMRACVQFFHVTPEKAPEPTNQPEPVPSSIRVEMVMLLAGMLLHHSRMRA
jgi:hypothetical protein